MRERVAEDWERLHNEEFHQILSGWWSEGRWVAGACSTHGNDGKRI